MRTRADTDVAIDEGEPEVLTRMRSKVEAVERNKNHILHKLLGDVTAKDFAPAF